MPKHLFKPRATLYSPPPSLTSNCLVVQIRLSPGSNRNMTSPKLSKSHRHFSLGLMFIAYAFLVSEVSIPRNRAAFSKQTSLIKRAIIGSSSGSKPASISFPKILHRIRRKYSWRGKDMNDRESVTMPTKLESSPQLDNALSCDSIP